MLQAAGLLVQYSIVSVIIFMMALVVRRGFKYRGELLDMFKASGRSLRFDRLQAFGLSMAFIAFYAVEAAATGVTTGQLPEVNETLLAVLVGSQAIYLSGKMSSSR